MYHSGCQLPSGASTAIDLWVNLRVCVCGFSFVQIYKNLCEINIECQIQTVKTPKYHHLSNCTTGERPQVLRQRVRSRVSERARNQLQITIGEFCLPRPSPLHWYYFGQRTGKRLPLPYACVGEHKMPIQIRKKNANVSKRSTNECNHTSANSK